MKFRSLVFCICILLLSDAESLSTRKHDKCYETFYPTPRQSFDVVHTSEKSSYICRDMSFSGWDEVDTVTRESCVRIEQINIGCSQTLEYRTDSRRSRPVKSYDCYNTTKDIPVFCTFEKLYIRVQSEEDNENYKVVYTVYSGKEKPKPSYDDDDIPAAVGSAVFGLFFVILLISVVCIAQRRARQRQNQGTGVSFQRNQQPPVHIHHHYHQGDQGMTSNQGQIQGQPLLPQGYNVPPTAPPQLQVYPQYPSGQQMIHSHPPPHVQQPIKDMSGPPSYDEVTKQKP